MSRMTRVSAYRPAAGADEPGTNEMPETVVHFQIRMPPVMHERLASRARDEKSSLNAMIVTLLNEAVERHGAKGGPAAATSGPRGAGPG